MLLKSFWPMSTVIASKVQNIAQKMRSVVALSTEEFLGQCTACPSCHEGDVHRPWLRLLSHLCLYLQLLWRYNNEAIHLRVQHHITAEKGMEAHTVFVQDIPGIPSGTFVNRIETRALMFLPAFVKVRHCKAAS